MSIKKQKRGSDSKSVPRRKRLVKLKLAYAKADDPIYRRGYKVGGFRLAERPSTIGDLKRRDNQSPLANRLADPLSAWHLIFSLYARAWCPKY